MSDFKEKKYSFLHSNKKLHLKMSFFINLATNRGKVQLTKLNSILMNEKISLKLIYLIILE